MVRVSQARAARYRGSADFLLDVCATSRVDGGTLVTESRGANTPIGRCAPASSDAMITSFALSLSGEGRTVCQVPPLAHRVGIGVVDGTGRGSPRPLKAAQR